MLNMKTSKIYQAIALLGLLGMTQMALASVTTEIHTTIQPQIQASQDLPPSIRQKMNELALSDSEVSIWVKPINATAPLINHRADIPRVPASTQKLISTFMALDVLGGNHHWYTRIYQKGVVANGTLYGDIVIQGQGDPSLTHARLQALLEYLPYKGIRHIAGDIIIDNIAFQGVAGDVNAFDGQGIRAYNAQPNAFLVNFGTLEIDMLPSGQYRQTGQYDRFGEPVLAFVPTDNSKLALQILPPLADFNAPKVLNATGGDCNSTPNFHLSETALVPTGNAQTGCGRITQWLTFANGDAFAVKAVKGVWQKIDPQFKGVVRLRGINEKLPLGLPIVSYPSRSLSAQIYDVNQHSNNVMTEQVALSLPLALGETVSTYPKTFAMINTWWSKHFKSTPPVMTKASGLCRDCYIKPNAMGEMLEFAYHHKEFATFRESLPIAGKTGTMAKLSKRNPTNPAIGRAFIKTGTLDDVSSMAGYVYDSQNNAYVVVGMINAKGAGWKGVAVLDEMLAVVASR